MITLTKTQIQCSNAILTLTLTDASLWPCRGYNATTSTLHLATPLLAAIGKDAWIQTLAFQGRNIFHGNSFADNGACHNPNTS